MALKDDWQAAKRAWERNGLPVLEQDIEDDMEKAGWDSGKLGSKLAAFDTAKDLEAKKAATPAILKQVDVYRKALKKAIGATKVNKAKLGLLTIDDELDDILDQVEKDSQPPKPSGRAEKVELVAMQNVAGGRRPVWLKGGTLDVKAYLVVDEHVAELEKGNKLGYHWIEIQKECSDLVKSYGERFVDTIERVEASLGELEAKANQAEYDKKVREANDVLKQYTGYVEAEVNKLVDAYWARALQRRAYLKAFKKEVKTDLLLSGVAIVASSVSIAMSFGAAALSAAVIAKSVLDIALTLEKSARTAETVRSSLEQKMDDVQANYNERLQALKNEETQKKNKAAQVGREAVASALGPISAKLMTTTSRALKEAQEFLGKNTACEDAAGDMVAKIGEFTSKFSSAPSGPDARSSNAMAMVHRNFMAMQQQYYTYTAELRKDIKWGEACVTTCEKLSKEDYAASFTKTLGVGTKTAVAIAGLARTTVQLTLTLV